MISSRRQDAPEKWGGYIYVINGRRFWVSWQIKNRTGNLDTGYSIQERRNALPSGKYWRFHGEGYKTIEEAEKAIDAIPGLHRD